MKLLALVLTLSLLIPGYGQTYHVGFQTLKLKDSSRIYKPGTPAEDPLHYRPVELDIWYPSMGKVGKPMTFGDLFRFLEERAVLYQDEESYDGITEELAQFYVAELGIGTDGQKLLGITTKSYSDLTPLDSADSLNSGSPLILYLAGFNGMGFENYRVIEQLVQSGYMVASIWSVGRYPGNMTNQKEDMMEQVLDAEFALNYLKKNPFMQTDPDKIGVLGCSWGGMSTAALIRRNPEIQAFVSLDGTESHYFGEEDENDRFIQEIYDDNLLAPETRKASYLYFESGDKLNEFHPQKEYSYYKKLNSEKYYLRFTNSTHADFTCIPSILSASENSITIYSELQRATLAFFNMTLKDEDDFSIIWEELKNKDHTSILPFDLSKAAISLTKLSGTISEDKTGEVLPYVNIGVLNRDRGTVSDTNGRFTLDLTEEMMQDTLRISSIGYQPVDFLICDLSDKESVSVSLKEDIDELDEIIVPVKGLKKKILGNKTQSRFMGTGFSYDQLGAEMGIKINVRNQPTYVDAFNFFVSYNRLSASSVFRVNFYSIERGKPHMNLLKENILVKIDPKQTGEFTVDLQDQNIVLTEDVIVSLEWVETEGTNNKGEAIFFSLALFNNGTIYKKSSQARFKKYSNLGVGFNIDVRY